MNKQIFYRKWLRNRLIQCAHCLCKWLPQRPGKRIIAFHEIKDTAKFRDKLEWLVEQYEVISLSSLMSCPVGRRTQISLTFDDGYACWYDEALPILTDLNVPAVFFVCSGFLGLQGQAADEFRLRHLRRHQKLKALTKPQLIEIAHFPLCEIGSHSIHHIDLGLDISPEMLNVEIGEDRKKLEDWTGKPIRWFAYPFGGPGHISSRAVDTIRYYGFSAAFTLVPGFWKPDNNRFKVNRDSLDINESVELWEAWLAGRYDTVYGLKSKSFDLNWIK